MLSVRKSCSEKKCTFSTFSTFSIMQGLASNALNSGKLETVVPSNLYSRNKKAIGFKLEQTEYASFSGISTLMFSIKL